MSFLRRCCRCCRCCCWWRHANRHRIGRQAARQDSDDAAAAAEVEVARAADDSTCSAEEQQSGVQLEVIVAASINRPRASYGGGGGSATDNAAVSLLWAAEEAEADEAAAAAVCDSSVVGGRPKQQQPADESADVVVVPPPQPPPGSLDGQEVYHEALLALMNACRRGGLQPLLLDRRLSLVAMEAWRLMARSPLGFLGQRPFDFRLVDQSPTADYGCLTFCDLAGHPGSDCLSAAVHFWSSEGCIEMFCDAKQTAAACCSGFIPEHWRHLIPWNLSDGADLADRMARTRFLPGRRSNLAQLRSSECTRVGFHIGWHSLPEGFQNRQPICIVAVFDVKDSSVP